MTLHSRQTEAIAKALEAGKIVPGVEGMGFTDSLIDRESYAGFIWSWGLWENYFYSSYKSLDGLIDPRRKILASENTLGRLQNTHIKMGDNIDDIHSEEPYWPF